MQQLKIGDTTFSVPSGYQTGGFDRIWWVIHWVFDLLIFGGIFLCLIFIVLSGIKYITSSGDPKAAAGAKASLTYALLGLFLLLFSYTIIRFIQTIFGVDLGVTPAHEPLIAPTGTPGTPF